MLFCNATFYVNQRAMLRNGGSQTRRRSMSRAYQMRSSRCGKIRERISPGRRTCVFRRSREREREIRGISSLRYRGTIEHSFHRRQTADGNIVDTTWLAWLPSPFFFSFYYSRRLFIGN
ncbi:hypothetical protein PUN28_006062 [Cardiocondyla obscurior]|uniref:Uncharacterized protein n=1 Tax=Cardiocondyla obscurior TaxID=286306 RepID=A0AAW2G7J2_9HYME